MHSRTRRRLVGGVVGFATVIAIAPVGWTTGEAQAAETCFGLPATITAGAGQTEVRGTEGDDVIVTDHVSRVLALGGDDAVCVTGPARIEAGDGNDRVRSRSGAGTKNIVILGSGSDLFEGSDADDEVFAEQAYSDDDYGLQSSPGTGPENTDTIRSDGGDDFASTGAPGDTAPNDDHVSAGSGDDIVSLIAWRGGLAEASGGPGTDWFQTLRSPEGAATVSIDLAGGTAAADGLQYSTVDDFENVDVYHLSHTPGSALQIEGTEAPNRIVAWGRAGAITIHTGGGDDAISAFGGLMPAPTTVEIDAGDGDDTVGASTTRGVDEPGRVSVLAGPGDDAVSAGADGFADRPGRVSVDGSEGDDSIMLSGVPERVLGGPGRDTVEMLGYGDDKQNLPVVFDLAHELFTRGDVTAPFATERLTVKSTGVPSADVRILGTSRRDVITTGECGTVVRGAGGADLLRSTTTRCTGVATTLYGNTGGDTLRGGPDRDVLLGGPGRDRALGGPGRDRCRAEITRSCERR